MKITKSNNNNKIEKDCEVPIRQFTILKTVTPSAVIEYCACIWHSRGAIAEHFTIKSEKARDDIFSLAYLKD